MGLLLGAPGLGQLDDLGTGVLFGYPNLGPLDDLGPGGELQGCALGQGKLLGLPLQGYMLVIGGNGDGHARNMKVYTAALRSIAIVKSITKQVEDSRLAFRLLHQ